MWVLALAFLTVPIVESSSPGDDAPSVSTRRQLPEASAYPSLTAEQIERVRSAIAAFRADPRGPYLRIRWFCNDGTVQPPVPYACRDHGGGTQHAEFKPEAVALRELGFHLGTILTALPYEEFVDAEHAHYRLQELVLERYLEKVDDGWVMHRARYYRGARQVENEERTGRSHLERLLADRDWRARNLLLATRVAAAVPHGVAGIPGERMRSLATEIADLDPAFQNLRIKIHSRPGPDDLDAVAAYRARLPQVAPETLRTRVEELYRLLVARYTNPVDRRRLDDLAGSLDPLPIAGRVRQLEAELRQAGLRRRVTVLADLLADARVALDGELPGTEVRRGRLALTLVDLINYGSGLLKAVADTWVHEQAVALGVRQTTGSMVDGAGHLLGRPVRPAAGGDLPTRHELIRFVDDLARAAHASGWLLDRELEAIGRSVRGIEDPRAGTAERALLPLAYRDHVDYLSRVIEWAHGGLRQAFGLALERYRRVEPLVAGFDDDQMRDSVLLPYAAALDLLARDAGRAVGLLHTVFDVELHTGLLGLNPGVAVGPLEVVERIEELDRPDPGAIYVLPETPAELGKVAGILTLQEGSRLSHVQILARSLGLPNAVVTPDLLPLLRQHQGETVIYAVSSLGTVVLTRTSRLPEEQLAAVRAGGAGGVRFAIDTDKLALDAREILPLESVDLQDSGRIVGPKAANLGRLHRLFPGRVAPGLVIPFGVFRRHIDRDLRQTGRTLHEDLVTLYRTAEERRERGEDPEEIDGRLLEQLQEIHDAIVNMELLPDFAARMESAMADHFGPDGTYGVFVRSDTNVEDLPRFSGAGLNLTVMNQIGTEGILHAIKRVWASPFSERSYTWRQSLLENPEHVYPSVVLLRSVPADVSGVLVTTDLVTGDPDQWTVTISEGIGGVVEGEPAETLRVPPDGGTPVLLSSARSVWRKVLRTTGVGGIERLPVRRPGALLTDARLEDLREVVGKILETYPPVPGPDGAPLPWDVEFGFVGDEMVLFQIRPLATQSEGEVLEVLTAMDSAVLTGESEPVRLDDPPRLQ